MPDDTYAKILQVLRRQCWPEILVDRVPAECRLILFEAKAPQPTFEFHAGALTCPARMMVQAKQRVHCRGSSSNGTILLGKGPLCRLVAHHVQSAGLVTTTKKG